MEFGRASLKCSGHGVGVRRKRVSGKSSRVNLNSTLVAGDYDTMAWDMLFQILITLVFQ